MNDKYSRLLSKYNPDIDFTTIKGKAIAIGAFDGCHLGHIELLKKADYALAFWPLPKALFSKDIKCLTVLEEKKSLFNDFLFVEFDKRFASQSADYFMQFIEETFAPKKIIVGWDFRFGRRLEGGVLEIEQYIYKRKLDVELIVIPPVLVDGEIAKSTTVREHLISGRLNKANSMLGYEFFCISEVVKGKGVGKTLGFPTINLVIDDKKQLPMPGVYAGKVLLSDNREYKVAISLLDREGRLELEAFLIDFSGDLYGQKVKLSFSKFLRPSQKFASFEELKDQIAKDVASVS
ncbi:MAG: riboflavin kinase [Candidatus Riflemargulisbacteria bacterium]